MKRQYHRVRSVKQSDRWKQKMERYRERELQIRSYAPDILRSVNFSGTRAFLQHGNVNVREHSMNVARYSLLISYALRINCNRREMVRGALLHDYFLYDWHTADPVNPHRLHGFYHPGRAHRNASEEYLLTPREADIIKKHMWPLTVVPPMCREAWIVTAADKWCSLLETIHIHKGHGLYPNEEKEEEFETSTGRINEARQCGDLSLSYAGTQEKCAWADAGGDVPAGYYRD